MAEITLYMVVVQDPARPVTDTWGWLSSTCLNLEKSFLGMGMTSVSRLDYVDGSRVYRLPPPDAARLEQDSQGPYLWSPVHAPPVKLRFDESHTVVWTAILREWTCIA